jgi:hypothetical protein
LSTSTARRTGPLRSLQEKSVRRRRRKRTRREVKKAQVGIAGVLVK